MPEYILLTEPPKVAQCMLSSPSRPLTYIITIAFYQFPMYRSFKDTFIGCKLDVATSYLRIQQQLSTTSFSNDLFLSCLFISYSLFSTIFICNLVKHLPFMYRPRW